MIEKGTKVKVLACRIIRDSSGLSKCIAFIDFASEDLAEQCLDASTDLEIKIYKQRPPENQGEEERTAFINNLEDATTEKTIREKF